MKAVFGRRPEIDFGSDAPEKQSDTTGDHICHYTHTLIRFFRNENSIYFYSRDSRDSRGPSHGK